jgi:uncharacterized protein YkwD
MRIPAVLLTGVMAIACALPAARVEADAGETDGAVDHARVAADVLAEANLARQSARVPPLAHWPVLDRAAHGHAIELARRGVLDHRSATAGRETVTARIEAAGGTWRSAGENLFFYSFRGRSAVLTTVATDELARHTIRGWLDSPGHRRNLLNGGFTHAGTGVARDEAGGWYVVQVYALPGPVPVP